MNVNKLDLRLQRETEGYTFLMGNLTENTKRKRQQGVRVTFVNSDGGQPLNLPAAIRTRDYCDDNGNFKFLVTVKLDRYAKETPFFVSFKMFDWLEIGRLATLRVERLEEDGSVSATGTLNLMVDSDHKIVKYTDEKYIEYLEARGTLQQKIDFSKRGGLEPADLDRLLGLIATQAESQETGEAEFALYHLYGDASFVRSDEEEAEDWLRKAAQKRHPEAGRIFKETVPPPQPPVADRPDSLEACLASAEGGNVEAQYLLFEHYTGKEDHDDEKALRWLEKAARSGHDKSVQKMEAYYLDNYLVDADTGHFLRILEQASQCGSVAAKMVLFKAYFDGECLRRPIRKDKRLSLKYLQEAAVAGDIEASYRMWQHFETGNDLLISETAAVEMLQRAADGGNSDAMNDLGELYVTGRIVSKENTKGVELIRKAADLGCVNAQIRVYHMWFDGRYYDVLLETDRQEAFRRLRAYAQENNNPRAQIKLWEAYLDKNPVMLTRFEALDYLRMAANSDDMASMFILANVELTGVYKDVDTDEGFNLLARGAKLGCPDAQLALFELYYTGEYYALKTQVNKERAYKWITKSAVSNPQALYKMWDLYASGNEMELDPADALEMLFGAVGKKCRDALYAVAVLFAQGDCVQLDIDRALKYLTMAAELEHPKSMYKLYEVYTSGRFEKESVPKNTDLGHRMLLLSAQHDYVPACTEVWKLYNDHNPIKVDRTFAEECHRNMPGDGNAHPVYSVEKHDAPPPAPPEEKEKPAAGRPPERKQEERHGIPGASGAPGTAETKAEEKKEKDLVGAAN